MLLHLRTGLNLVVAILIGAAVATGLPVVLHYLKMRIPEIRRWNVSAISAIDSGLMRFKHKKVGGSMRQKKAPPTVLDLPDSPAAAAPLRTSNFATLANAIDMLVDEFARAGKGLDVERAAFGFWATYPDRDMTFEEIAFVVARAAEGRKVKVVRPFFRSALTDEGHT